MSTSERFSLFPLSFAHVGGTLNLAQLESFNANFGSRVSDIIPGGAVDRAHIGIAAAEPSLTFGTRDIITALTDISITAGLGSTSTCTARIQERSDAGTFETGATHETFTCAKAFIRPTTLSASQDDDNGALLNLEMTPLSSDGFTDPVAHNTGVDFGAAPAPAFVSRYFLGPVYYDPAGAPVSADIKGVTNVTVNFGINYEARRFDGKPFAQLGSIKTRTPTITVTTAKIDGGATLSPFGRTVGDAIHLYFLAGTANGTRVALGSSAHIKITVSAGMWRHDTLAVTGNEDGTLSYEIRPTGVMSISLTSTVP